MTALGVTQKLQLESHPRRFGPGLFALGAQARHVTTRATRETTMSTLNTDEEREAYVQGLKLG